MHDCNSGIDFKNGDVKAFEIVFKSYYPRLTIFANKFLNDLDVAEEIASETLTCLWERRESISISSSLSSYLYRMVQNRALNYLKRQRVENEYVAYLMRNNLIQDIPDSYCDPYQEKELAEQVRRAIDALPEKCRQVFLMSRFEYLKNREIAAKLDISQKTVERQITIALEKLRKNLEYIALSLLIWY